MFKIHVIGNAHMICVEWCGPIEHKDWKSFVVYWQDSAGYFRYQMAIDVRLEDLKRFLSYAEEEKWKNLSPEFGIGEKWETRIKEHLLDRLAEIHIMLEKYPKEKYYLSHINKIKADCDEFGLTKEWLRLRKSFRPK